MLQEAIKKLKDEIGNDKGYKQIIGGYLLKQLEANPTAADQILKEGKNIKGAMEAMKAEARKHQNNGCAVLTDDEGFAVVLEYYDIPLVQINKLRTCHSADFNVSLDDLL